MLNARLQARTKLTAPGEPYELRVTEIAGRPRRVFVNAPATLNDLYRSTLSDAPFLVYGEDRLTFNEVYDQAARLAQALVHDFAVQAGDRVAISMRNYPEWIIAFKAATAIGAVAVALNALWSPEELDYGLTHCGAKVLFVDPERLERLRQGPARRDMTVILARGGGSRDGANAFDEVLALQPRAEMPASSTLPDDPATIFYTSGSTGHPKGVVSSHRAIISALLGWELELHTGLAIATEPPPEPLNPPAVLLAAPLFHVMGSHVVYLASYRQQRKIVSMRRWDPEEAARHIEAERITAFSATPAMTGDLVRVAKASGRDLSSLTTVGGGGAARAPEQVRQIDAVFERAAPSTGWGMTETNAIGTTIGGPTYLAKPTSAGPCVAVLDMKIIDDEGRELPPGQRGELLVRGTAMFSGYWDRPELNAEVFIDDWFRTGDVAYLDEEGFLFIVDRIKDLIIRGGENIGCGQVEAALLMYPGVHEAAVYSVPDERLGEEVGATIHADPGVDLHALRTFLEAHLAKFEIPKYIVHAPGPLPRIASGKIFKRLLREEAMASIGPSKIAAN
jgi:long-chain acyl-CoA synthetase